MLKFSDIAVIFMALSASAFSQSAAVNNDAEAEPDYPVLKTEKGEVYRNCFVKKVDPDGLVLQHSEGVAHVSFFELSADIQEKYDFDPVAALQEYKTRIAQQRETRKELLIEAEKFKAAEARADAVRKLYQVAKVDWIPAEGRIVAIREDGIFVRAQQVVMVPTTVISTLGFENEGPPKRTLQNFGDGLTYLRIEDHEPRIDTWKRGSKWKGYIEPVTLEKTTFVSSDESGVPVHRALSLIP